MDDLKLNLGCGRTILSGWVNIDNSPSVVLAKVPFIRYILFKLKIISPEQFENQWSKDIVWCDVSRKIPYPDSVVDRVYSSHFLEHIEKEKGETVLRETFRILKKGGIFRLVVPDLVFHAQRYLKKISGVESIGREPHDELLFNIYGAFLEAKRFGAWHRYMYDWPTLQFLLNQVGFSRVVRQPYQKSLDPELARLDSRPEDSLHIDAVK